MTIDQDAETVRFGLMKRPWTHQRGADALDALDRILADRESWKMLADKANTARYEALARIAELEALDEGKMDNEIRELTKTQDMLRAELEEHHHAHHEGTDEI